VNSPKRKFTNNSMLLLHWPTNHSRCGLCMRRENCLLAVEERVWRLSLFLSVQLWINRNRVVVLKVNAAIRIKAGSWQKGDGRNKTHNYPDKWNYATHNPSIDMELYLDINDNKQVFSYNFVFVNNIINCSMIDLPGLRHVPTLILSSVTVSSWRLAHARFMKSCLHR